MDGRGEARIFRRGRRGAVDIYAWMEASDGYILRGAGRRAAYVNACVRGGVFGVEDTCWVVGGDNLVKGQGYVGGFGGLRRSGRVGGAVAAGCGVRQPYLRVTSACMYRI